MKKLLIAKLVLLIVTMPIWGQSSDKIFPLHPKAGGGVRASDCTVKFDSIRAFMLTASAKKDALIIIMSHLGKEESARLGKRRLYNAKTYLTSIAFDLKYRRDSESILIAEGEREAQGAGFLDFYIEGEIELRIFFEKNEDLLLGSCVLNQSYEKFCKTDFEKLFYPCKKN
jgi:hypothetical protein